MDTIVEYEYTCQTESTTIKETRLESDAPPTTCKNNIAHTIIPSTVKTVHKKTQTVVMNRSPLVTDNLYPIGTEWINTNSSRTFYCVSNDTLAKWVTTSMRYPDIHLSFATNQEPFVEKSTTGIYQWVSMFLYPGSLHTFSENPTNISLIAGSSGSDSLYWRIYDQTNSSVIAESNPQTNTTLQPISLGISNTVWPTESSIWEIQVKNTTAMPTSRAKLAAIKVSFE